MKPNPKNGTGSLGFEILKWPSLGILLDWCGIFISLSHCHVREKMQVYKRVNA